MVVALAALFVALGGPAQAAKLIDGRDIRKGTVASKQVKDRSLRTRDLAASTLRKLSTTPDRSIAESKLADNAVSTRALAPASVLTGSVADGTLTAADLAANSVTIDEVADNAIGQPEIRNNGVGETELADNTIDTDKVVDGALTMRDLAKQIGTLSWPLGVILPTECEVSVVEDLGIDITGDYVLVSPVTALPNTLIYTANGTGTRALRLQACNRGLLPTGAATYRFNYAVIGN
jgi:hypothetical protein